MAKRSQKRAVRYEKDQSGCMWGLISIFDFRHGRTTRKLIADRRHGGKHAIGKNSVLLLVNMFIWICVFGMKNGATSSEVFSFFSFFGSKFLRIQMNLETMISFMLVCYPGLIADF